MKVEHDSLLPATRVTLQLRNMSVRSIGYPQNESSNTSKKNAHLSVLTKTENDIVIKLCVGSLRPFNCIMSKCTFNPD